MLCDGAGSAAMGGEGAHLVARYMSIRARAHFVRSTSHPDDETILRWIADTRNSISRAAGKRQLQSSDFASTMVCVFSDGSETTVAHIGDGCVVASGSLDCEWEALTWPAQGEYASTTYFITDEPKPKIRISRRNHPVSALVAFTDGMERLALDFAALRPHAPFFQGIVSPVKLSQSLGRDAKLSEHLQKYLNSAAVNARTDDDKTLLAAIFR